MAKQSKLSFVPTTSFAEMSAAADAAGAAEEAECLRILEDRTAAADASDGWACIHAEQASEFTASGRRAGLPNELHPKFELAKSTAVPSIPKNPSEV